MITNSKESIVALIATVLFACATGFSIYYYAANTGNKEKLSTEKVNAERMLSEKLALSKEIESLKVQIESHRGKNKDLDKKLTDLTRRLEASQHELNQQSRSDHSKELASLRAIKKQLSDELAALNQQLVALNEENTGLRAALTKMEASHEELSNNNYMLTQMMADKYEIDAMKTKEKLTVRAKKVKEIVMGFDLPSDMTENLSFVITSPDGKKVNSTESKLIHYAFNDSFEFSDETVVASTGVLFAPGRKTKRVALSYKPAVKLKSGVYQIDIFSSSNYLGSSQIKLQ